MAPTFALFLALGWASGWLRLQGSCEGQSESAAAPAAAGCGCGNLQRAADVEKLEDGTVPAEPAVKYSRGANERDEQEAKSQVRLAISANSPLNVLHQII